MRTLKYEELALVAGGGEEAPPCEEHADNGWGNGIDGTNPGSDNGNELQVATKLNEENPRADKFTGR